jgi:hypothetical protein
VTADQQVQPQATAATEVVVIQFADKLKRLFTFHFLTPSPPNKTALRMSPDRSPSLMPQGAHL